MKATSKRSDLRKMARHKRNTRLVSLLIIIIGMILLVLLMLWFFGGKDNLPDKAGSDPSVSERNSGQEGSENDHQEETDNPNTDDGKIHQIIETTEVEPSDGNVIRAYTGDWQIVKTIQNEPHTINYSNGSQDRIEIKEGVMRATGLNKDHRTWWVGNDGDKKVVATVSNDKETKFYRVYLSWITDQGWQPTKVELLKENDKKLRK